MLIITGVVRIPFEGQLSRELVLYLHSCVRSITIIKVAKGALICSYHEELSDGEKKPRRVVVLPASESDELPFEHGDAEGFVYLGKDYDLYLENVPA